MPGLAPPSFAHSTSGGLCRTTPVVPTGAPEMGKTSFLRTSGEQRPFRRPLSAVRPKIRLAPRKPCMRRYSLRRLRHPVVPTVNGHAALSPGRGKSPRQRSHQPGQAVRRPTPLSTPPTPPFPHAPRRPLGAGLFGGVDDPGASFHAQMCAAGARAPETPSRTGESVRGAREGGVPSLWVSMGRGGTSCRRLDEDADCCCQRSPKSEGATSTLGVGRFC